MFSEEVKKVCEYYKNKHKSELRYHEFYNQIKSETDFLSENASIGQRSWHVLNNTKDIPKCLECGIKEVKWYKKYKNYSIFCSIKCAANNENVRTKFKQTNLNRYGVENAAQSEVIKNRYRHTNLNRYGVDNPMKLKEFQDKLSNVLQKKTSEEKKLKTNKYKQTNLDKYGVEHPMKLKEVRNKLSGIYQSKSEEEKAEIKRKREQICLKKYNIKYPSKLKRFQDKSKQTNLYKYGVDNIMKLKELQNKFSEIYQNKSEEEKEKILRKYKQTNLDKYGTDNPMKLEEYRDKLSLTLQNKSEEDKILKTIRYNRTCSNKYGVEHASQKHLSKDTLEKLKDPKYLEEQHHNKKKTLTEIAKELELANVTSVSPYFHKYNIPILTYPSSTGEKEVVSYIKEVYQKDFPTNTRKVITPLELDIYLEDLKLAVEFNGTYWHSSEKKSEDYHFNKVVECYKKKVKLINIYEYEWENDKEEIKYWLKKYITNNLDDIITKDVYLKDIADKKEFTLSLNWPINYELLKKNNFKFKETLESEFIKIKNFYIYDAGKIILERRK